MGENTPGLWGFERSERNLSDLDGRGRVGRDLDPNLVDHDHFDAPELLVLVVHDHVSLLLGNVLLLADGLLRDVGPLLAFELPRGDALHLFVGLRPAAIALRGGAARQFFAALLVALLPIDAGGRGPNRDLDHSNDSRRSRIGNTSGHRAKRSAFRSGIRRDRSSRDRSKQRGPDIHG